jgi:hypothetical protein
MLTKQDYLGLLETSFEWNIKTNHIVFKNYGYASDYQHKPYLHDFFNEVKLNGMSISDAFHKHGIGNNNEYRIFLEETDSQGFVIEKNIATLHITYGIYGGISVWLEDYNTKKEICGIHYAR